MARPLSSRQVELLRWLGDGCPGRDWPDHTHKIAIRALESRGLATIGRKDKVWVAAITERGRHYLEHDRYPPPIASDPPTPDPPAVRPARVRRRVDHSAQSAVARAEQRISHPLPQVRLAECAIQETRMRYKIVVTRVQVAERFVRATCEEDAASKMRDEIARPYGYVGSWKTIATEVDVVEAEQTTVIKPTPIASDGVLLLSAKEAGKALGVTSSTLYDLINNGEIDHLLIGSRKYVSRKHLTEFIERNTRSGDRRSP